MKIRLKQVSIRTRLLVIYIAILLVGFAGLTLVAGQQISSGAREDYEQRLKGEVTLIAQAVARNVNNYLLGNINTTDLKTSFSSYDIPVNGSLVFLPMQDNRQSVGSSSPDGDRGRRDGFQNEPELEVAQHGGVSVDERLDSTGQDTLFTATQVIYDGNLLGLVQLSVPITNLQTLIIQRWLELAVVLALVTFLGIAAAFWLARSIIQPLYKLRESAVQLSKGDFSHRVRYDNQDEIGEVAHAFNEMAIQVESMLEEQRAFASNTSHEMRTPLTTIRLRTEALRYDPNLKPDVAKRYVEEIDDEVARLGDLVEDLTLLSRFDAGRAELGQEQIDMVRFATNLRDRMLPLAREKNITLSLIPPTESVIVKASINHLSVIFRNLLENAIKYTPKGGEITWAIQQVESSVQHTITDTGHGIEADDLLYIFERFYRVDKARSRDVPGTGLGLALVKSIVEAYGGKISVESGGLDKGTTVTVMLPKAQSDSI